MKYKTTQKDRYGNMRSIEIESDGQLEVPPMTSIPQYEARGGEAETHPGEPRGSDTVPAWLTPGEFVVNKEATDIFGPQIKQMNDIGRAIQNGTPPIYASQGIRAGNYDKDIWKQHNLTPIENLSKHFGYPIDEKKLLEALAWIESRGGQDTSKPNSSAVGPFQILEGAAKDPGSEMWGYYPLPLDDRLDYDKSADWVLNNLYVRAGRNPEWNLNDLIQSHIAGEMGVRSIKDRAEDGSMSKFSAWNAITKPPGSSPYDQMKFPHKWKMKYDSLVHNKPEWDPYIMVPGGPNGKEIMNWKNPFYSGYAEGPTPYPYVRGTNILTGGEETNIPSDAGDGNIFSVIKDWWTGGDASLKEVPELPKVEILNLKNNEWKDIEPDKNTDRGTSQNWNKGGAVHLDPGGVVWGLTDNKEEEEKQNDLMDFIFPESYVHKQMLPPLDGRPNYDEAISFDTSKYDATTPKDNVTSSNTFASLDDILRERYKDTPFGAIDDHPSEYRRGNKTWTVPKRSNIPVPKDFQGDYGEQIPIIPFGTDDMIPGDMGKGTGSISNKKVSDYQNKIENLVPLEEGYKIPFTGLQPIDPDAYDQDVGDEMSKNLVDEYTDAAMKSTTVPHGKGKFGQPWDVSKDMPKSPPRKVSAILSALEANKVRREKLVRDLAAKKITSPGGKKKLLADLKELEIEKSKLEVELANSKRYTEMLPVWNKLNNLAALRNKRAELQANLDASQTTSEREYWASEIKDIDERISKLDPDIQQKIDNKKEKELKVIKDKADKEKLKDLYKHWNSSKGQKDISELIKTSKTNPNWDKTKNMFNFIFGDLIDRREIARAIAVYLGSRAMGYQHGESIGFVAEQYLERVDKKNAAWDKWMLEHAHKYKKSSVAEYKRTGDPSVLEPIGSAPRMQSTEPKLWFSKQYPNGRYAWEFKIEGPGGKDIGFWAYDQLGQNMVGSDAHADPRLVPDQPENDELIAKQSEMVLKILKSEEARIDRTKVRMENNVKKWDQITNLNLASTAWDIAKWANENDIRDMRDLNSGILTAYAMAVEESKKTGIPVGDIIPFLEEALIKPRLLGEAAELVSAPVGNDLVTMEDKALVDINKDVKSLSTVGMTPSQFWEWARNEWTSTDNKFYKQNNKTYKQHYQEVAKKKENAGYTPFALFVMQAIKTFRGSN
tara:strand:+ start:291 stop:3794 length:3504 start_codon:yes stop_codon:yes gene_type:complete